MDGRLKLNYSNYKLVLPYIYLTVVPLIWAGNFIVGKVLIGVLPPFSISAGRFIVGALILGLLLLNLKDRTKLDGILKIKILILGLTGVFAFNSLLYIGLKYTTAINATLINSFSPIVTIYCSWLFLKENIGYKQILGSFFAILGIIIIQSQGSPAVLYNLDFNIGDLIIFLNTFIWAIFTILGKNVMYSLSPMETTTYSTLAGLPFLFLASGWEISHTDIALSWPIAAGILYLGVFATVLAFIWYYKGIQMVGVAKSANFYNLIPVYSIFLAVFFLQEQITPYHITGGFCVMLGIVLSSGNLKLARFFIRK
ncbi:DMT family transporter [Desulfoscipio sp. XC116]|uniref:DMT family transporter n=1 Tax=Desulfoscipio sp. XC116 TaxID=3144975 RepID=UPI00325A6889